MKPFFTRWRATLERCALLLILLGSNLPFAAACINPQPDTLPTVTVAYSPNFTQLEIRLSNLRLHTESPNVFCSCALSSYADVFTNVKYIAFIKGDSIPNAYENFSTWVETEVASFAWNGEYSSYPDWSGYVAEVINAGLSTNDDVSMIIRAEMPPGAIPNVAMLDSAIAVSYLGTDMWLPDEGTMAFDHTGLRNLRSDNNGFQMFQAPQAYFDFIDELLSGTSDGDAGLVFNLRLSPNPASDFLLAQYSLPRFSKVKATLFDLAGKKIWQAWQGELPPGEQEIRVDLAALATKNALILMELEIDGVRMVRRVVLN